jgi:hypothetical protein
MCWVHISCRKNKQKRENSFSPVCVAFFLHIQINHLETLKKEANQLPQKGVCVCVNE